MTPGTIDMRTLGFTARVTATLLAATMACSVTAGPGHDHGDAPHIAATAASPRFEAVSDAFELVGILDGKRLTLYLDRAEDNTPVRDAKLELELGGARLELTDKGSGIFEAELPAAPAPGVTPVTAIVVVGGESDLLAGDLDIHEDEHADEASVPWSAGRIAPFMGIGVLVLALLGTLRWAARRRAIARSEGAAR
jgi:hypothetical protein